MVGYSKEYFRAISLFTAIACLSGCPDLAARGKGKDAGLPFDAGLQTPDAGVMDIDAGPPPVCVPATPIECTDRTTQPVCDSNGWCWQKPLPTLPDLFAVWGRQNDVWVGGAGGAPLHWDGCVWTAYPHYGAQDDIVGLWGSDTNDIWAARNDGVISHWDGAAWSDVSEGLATDLRTVWGSGPNDVWAAGDKIILHWDGTLWSVDSHPDRKIVSLGGSGPNDVWAIGQGMWHDNSAVYRWDGARWSVALTDSNVTLNAVQAFAPDDVWITGGPPVGSHCSARHWNGVSWRTTAMPAESCTALWGTASNDLWAAGDGLSHWNGTSWSVVPRTVRNPNGLPNALLSAVTGDRGVVWTVGEFGNVRGWNCATEEHFEAESRDLNALWLADDGTGWMASDTWLGRWDGTTLTPVTFPGGSIQFTSFWGSGPDDVWAGGYIPGDDPKGIVEHWNGRSWTISLQVASEEINGLWGSGPQDIWAMGLRTLRHWDGLHWQQVFTEPGQSYGSIWGSGPNDVWVTTSDNRAMGSFRHWDGNSWKIDPYTQPGGLWNLWGSGPDDIWAGGTASFVHWDGHAWSTEHGACENCDGIYLSMWGTGPDDVWVVGMRDGDEYALGAMAHWDGQRWAAPPNAYGVATLTNVRASASGAIVAVGRGGTMLILQRPP